MNCQEMVAAAVVVGVVIGLLVVPAVRWLRLAVMKVVALWQANRSTGRAATRRKPKARRAKVGKSMPQSRQPRKKAGAAEVTVVSSRKQKVKSGAGKPEKVVSGTSADTTRRGPGRPSKAELARRAAEAVKAAEANVESMPNVTHDVVVAGNTHVQARSLVLSPDQSVVMPIVTEALLLETSTTGVEPPRVN